MFNDNIQNLEAMLRTRLFIVDILDGNDDDTEAKNALTVIDSLIESTIKLCKRV